MSKKLVNILEEAKKEHNDDCLLCARKDFIIDQALDYFLNQQPIQQECDAAMVEGFEHTISKEDEEWMNAPMGTPKQQPTAGEFTTIVRKAMIDNGREHSGFYDTVKLFEACDIIDSAESINADLLAASERGLSYINAIVCKVPRPITELNEDKEFVEAAIEKATKG